MSLVPNALLHLEDCGIFLLRKIKIINLKEKGCKNMNVYIKQKSKTKRIVAMILCVIFACMVSVTPVSAETIQVSATATSFTNAWEKVKQLSTTNASELRLKYGYNTTLINEDYARATSSVILDDYKHQAIIQNGNGTHYGDKVAYAYMSTVDVRHKGTSVTYINRAQR